MWFLTTLVNAIVTYGIALVLYAVEPASETARWFSAVLFWLLIIYNFWRLFVFVENVINDGPDARHALWMFLDVYIGMVHGLAGWGMSLWILDQSLGKTDFFIGINPAANAYIVYVGDFLMTSILLFNTAGFGSVRPAPSTLGGSLWAVATSLTGLFLIGFVLVIVLRGFKKRVPLDRKARDMIQQQQQNQTSIRVEWPNRVSDPGRLRNVRLPSKRK